MAGIAPGTPFPHASDANRGLVTAGEVEGSFIAALAARQHFVAMPSAVVYRRETGYAGVESLRSQSAPHDQTATRSSDIATQ